MNTWLHTLPSCPSTNTWALEHLSELAHGDCVWTQEQSAGRGQAGRAWVSDAGVLTASFIVIPQHSSNVSFMSLSAGLAIAHTVEDLLALAPQHKDTPPTQVRIKWPNDCLVHGRKLAGILCEGRQHNGQLYMVIGIGLNVHPQWTSADAAPPDSHFMRRPPISIHQLGASPSLPEVLTRLRQYILEGIAMIEHGRWDSLLTQLQARDCLLGQSVEITNPDRIIHGIGAGITADGALLLRLPDGGCIHCTSSHNLRILDVLP